MDLHHLLLAGLPAHSALPPKADIRRSIRVSIWLLVYESTPQYQRHRRRGGIQRSFVSKPFLGSTGVCTENLNPDIVVVKPAKDRA